MLLCAPAARLTPVRVAVPLKSGAVPSELPLSKNSTLPEGELRRPEPVKAALLCWAPLAPQVPWAFEVVPK